MNSNGITICCFEHLPVKNCFLFIVLMHFNPSVYTVEFHCYPAFVFWSLIQVVLLLGSCCLLGPLLMSVGLSTMFFFHLLNKSLTSCCLPKKHVSVVDRFVFQYFSCDIAHIIKCNCYKFLNYVTVITVSCIIIRIVSAICEM